MQQRVISALRPCRGGDGRSEERLHSGCVRRLHRRRWVLWRSGLQRERHGPRPLHVRRVKLVFGERVNVKHEGGRGRGEQLRVEQQLGLDVGQLGRRV